MPSTLPTSPTTTQSSSIQQPAKQPTTYPTKQPTTHPTKQPTTQSTQLPKTNIPNPSIVTNTKSKIKNKIQQINDNPNYLNKSTNNLDYSLLLSNQAKTNPFFFRELINQASQNSISINFCGVVKMIEISSICNSTTYCPTKIERDELIRLISEEQKIKTTKL